MSSRKNILIAGGCGFIGSHLVEKLSKDNNVIVIDNFSTGRYDNIAALIDTNQITFIRHDVAENVESLFPNTRFDEIYHLACPASPSHYQKTPIQTFKSSVLGTFNLMELAYRDKAKILLTSTSEIYGDPLVHPQVETYWGNVNPNGIRSCYDEGKRAAETLFMDYHREYNIDTRIIRIFNTYGPNMDIHDGRCVSNFICQSLVDADISIYGSGEQTRSFMYVDDLIEGIQKVMDSDIHTPINLGNPNELTINEIAKIIQEKTGSNNKIIHMPLPADDPTKRKPDITKAKEQLGWEPKVSLSKGLDYTINYFRKVLNQ